MKKFGIFALALVLVAMFTLPAMAVENEFGGYWRTRFLSYRNFDGEDAGNGGNLSAVDTRTRLYYTAKLNDNLKLVNKFEMDATWGVGGTSYGDVSADGIAVEVKNSYADFNLGPANMKVGVMGQTIARGIIFDDDCAGMLATFSAGDMVSIPVGYIKPYEGGAGDNNGALDTSNNDGDLYYIAPKITVAEGISLTPQFAYFHDDDVDSILTNEFLGTTVALDSAQVDLYYLGLDFDGAFGPASAYFTGMYQMGTVEEDDEDVDVNAWLLLVGGAFDMDMIEVHGEGLYATGQDEDEDDVTEYLFYDSWGYHPWSEIMGEGTFDVAVPNNCPGSDPTNIWYVGGGVTVKPVEEITFQFDLWYAQLNEDVAIASHEVTTVVPGTPPTVVTTTVVDDEANDLGFEVDARLTVELVQDLNLDLIGAYLFAGDAVTMDSDDDANPFEVGAQLSLSF